MSDTCWTGKPDLIGRLTSERDEWKKRASSLVRILENCMDENDQLRAALVEIRQQCKDGISHAWIGRVASRALEKE